MKTDSRQCLILAGGKGTRLAAVLGDNPKPMVPLAGKPLLEHTVLQASRYGFTDIVILAGFKADRIQAYFGDGSAWGVRIRYCVESVPRGTAGAVIDALALLNENFVVLYGDTLIGVNLDALWQEHIARGADYTLLLHPNDHPQDSDIVAVDADGWVTAIHPYPHPPGSCFRNLVNAALYVCRREALAVHAAEAVGEVDFGKHVFRGALARKQALCGYVTHEYIKDMGTPSRLKSGEADLGSGRLARRTRGHAMPAVFLDRDGTLNREVGHLKDPAQLELLPGVSEAVRRLNKADYLSLVITNQPVIARGDVTVEGLSEIHKRLEWLLGEGGSYLDGIFYCPHHPHRGFDGEISELKIDCECRKPKPGLLLRARAENQVDMANSWMIGDSDADIGAGRSAGVRTILVRSGRSPLSALRVCPDYEFFNLSEAVDFILGGRATLRDAIRAHLDLDAIRAGSVVLIAGVSRAGKSTLASVLSEMVHEKGLSATTVTTDAWLLPRDRRAAGEAIDVKYDRPAMVSFFRQLVDGSIRDREVHLSVYSRDGGLEECTRQLTLTRAQVVIVEGCGLALLDEFLGFTPHRYFVHCAESVRRSRFLAEYTLRGLAPGAIDSLYEARREAEDPSIQRLTSLGFLPLPV